MLLLRRIHAYIGFLIAPSVLFWALSGSLQLFDLHEPHGTYRPPALFQIMGSIHKDQVLSRPHHHDSPPPTPGQPQHNRPPAGRASTPLLKWYFLLVALGLATTTGIGLYVGFKTTRQIRLSWTLLIIGTALPICLLLIQA